MTLPFPLVAANAFEPVDPSPYHFGAIWDGESHPLSERYATLAEAQVVYPHALALTDEIDWAATQAAINSVILEWENTTGRFGKTVKLPGGSGRFNRAIFYPANSIFPYEDFPSVNIKGEALGDTQLQFRDNSAIIDGGYALQVKTADVVAGAVVWSGDHSTLHSSCVLSDFTIRGPGEWRGWVAPTSQAEFIERYGFTPTDWTTAYNTNNPRMGQVYENYSGISAGERTNLDRVGIRGFHVGLNLRGGQKWMREVIIDQCYYAVYGTFTAAAHGDMSLLKCTFSGRMAAFAMHPDYAFYGIMHTVTFVGSPYAFVKERSTSGTAGTHWADFVHGALIHCQFEGIDNGIIVEGNAATLNHECRNLTMDTCVHFPITTDDTSFPETTEHHLIDVVRDAPFYFRHADKVDIRNAGGITVVPGDLAMFVFQSAPIDFTLRNSDWWIEQAAAGSKPTFAFAAGTTPAVIPPGSITLEGEGYRGALMRVGTSNGHDIEIGHVIGQKVGRFFGRAAPGDRVIGVAVETNPTTSSNVYLCAATQQTGFLSVRQINGSTWSGDNEDEFELSPTELGEDIPLNTGRAIGHMFGTNGANNVWGHIYDGPPGLIVETAADQAAFDAATSTSGEFVVLNAQA